MTPETARLLQHWRSHRFGDIRPFFCQVEAVETAVWLTEVAPQRGREERQVLDHLDQASEEANPGLARLALKLATGAGKTTVMAMIVAWQMVKNTSTSKLVHDFIAGFSRENEDGSTTLVNGRLALFRNFDEHGNPLARPRTLLIDSEQLDSGEELDKNFRAAAGDEIERFRRERIQRTGDRKEAEHLSDQDLLREVMNTVGKPDTPGWIDPLHRLRLDAHRGLGRPDRHSRAGRPRIRHAAPLRAAHRPRNCAASRTSPTTMASSTSSTPTSSASRSTSPPSRCRLSPIDEALAHAEEALQDYAAETAKDGDELTMPTPLEQVEVPAGQTLVSIPLIRLSGRRVRANLFLDEEVAAFIDAEAARRGMTRTAYVGWMARRIAQMGG